MRSRRITVEEEALRAAIVAEVVSAFAACEQGAVTAALEAPSIAERVLQSLPARHSAARGACPNRRLHRRREGPEDA